MRKYFIMTSQAISRKRVEKVTDSYIKEEQ